MPGTILKSNNPSADWLQIGTVHIQGFGQNAGIEYEAPEKVTVTEGCDAETVANYRAVKHIKAKITLMATSVAYKQIMAQCQAQWALMESGLPPTPIPWFHFIVGTGTTVTAAYSLAMREPVDGTKREASEVEIEFHLQNYQIAHGTANAA
jgi:hypothetical protein